MPNDPQPKRKIGLKIDNSKSSVQSSNRISQLNELDEKAQGAIAKREEYNSTMYDLSVKFKQIVLDKTLRSNKTSIIDNVEKEIVNNLIELATEMNQDEHQPEGMGSNALCLVLMKMIIIQRDIINDLSYEVEKFKIENNKKQA